MLTCIPIQSKHVPKAFNTRDGYVFVCIRNSEENKTIKLKSLQTVNSSQALVRRYGSSELTVPIPGTCIEIHVK